MHDSKNHHGRGLCYLPNPTSRQRRITRANALIILDIYIINPTIVLLCIHLSACKEILIPGLGWVNMRANILSEGMISPLHVQNQVSDHRSYTINLGSCEIKAWKKFRLERDWNPLPLR